MKKKVFFLVAVFWGFITSAFPQKLVETDYYLSNPELGGDAIIKKSTKELVGDEARITFEVEVQSSGDYYASFWIFPTRLKDGTYATYDILVNDVLLDEIIKPKHGGWQKASLNNNKKLTLDKGANNITIIGKSPDVPNVEHVRLSRELLKAQVNDTTYKAYKSSVEHNSTSKSMMAPSVVEDSVMNEPLSAMATSVMVSNNSLYDYTYVLGVTLHYTF